MGNDQSFLSGLDIDDKAVEVADFWSQHAANLPKSQQLSYLTVFTGELFVNGPLWTIHTPLERYSKNLMIYRHPCILKYISSWSKSSKFYLAVEHVKPLSHVFSSLNTLQLCLGLHSILKALCFLHEKAAASHNNVCLASVYVTSDGYWKLGGMEFTCKYNELSKDFLAKSRANRYSAAICVNEENHIQNDCVSKQFIDSFAFFVLVSELLKSESMDEVPSLDDFIQLCKNGLENIKIEERPKLSDLISHPFFNHEFIILHSFLVELPLKSDEEKLVFFSNLSSALKKFNEKLVASQLSGLLLSRMVLLNSVAQKDLLPKILCFKQDIEHDEDDGGALFSEETFKEYLVPRLLEIFCVRDAQIRLLLLNHFQNFIHAFSEEELQSYILPELLVGIKDTNDILVSATLQALSVLVMILGANTVIGGRRAKLFTDGRPTSHSTRKSRQNSKRTISSIGPPSSVQNDIVLPLSQIDPIIAVNNLPERQRPDGEEVETLTDEVDQVAEEELEWEDWEIHEAGEQIAEHLDCVQNDNCEDAAIPSNQSSVKSVNTETRSNSSRRKKSIQDINDLDIKNQRGIEFNDDIDFFQDMEPEIESSMKYIIDQEPNKEVTPKYSNKLSASLLEYNNVDGWGEEDWSNSHLDM